MLTRYKSTAPKDSNTQMSFKLWKCFFSIKRSYL